MDEKEIVNKGIRLLTDVDEKEYFSVIDGTVLKNIKELASLLETIHIDHFGYHVNDHKNDFYNWIKYSVKDEELAERIKEAKSPDVMKTIILERIKELEDELEHYEEKFEEKNVENEEDYSKEADDLDKFFEEDKKETVVENTDFDNSIVADNIVEEQNVEGIVENNNVKSDYTHEEILEEIEKALNETDSVLGVKKEENKVLEEYNEIAHKSFSWIDFILGFVFGFILGLLLVIAYYKMYVLV